MDEREPFAELQPPRAPEGLKERVLRAAREVPTAAPERFGLIDHIWESRKWRWAWLGTVAVLLIAHVLLLRTEPRPPARAEDAAVFAPMVLDLGPGLTDPTFTVSWVDRGRPTLQETAREFVLGS